MEPARLAGGITMTLRRAILAAVLGAVALAVAATAPDHDPPVSRPSPGATSTGRPSPSPTPSPVPAQLHGFQLHMWGPGTTTGKLDALSAAGANVLRVDFGWSNLEAAGKGQYDVTYLQQFDELVNGAAARGIQVVITIWQSPCWASSLAAKNCAGPWWTDGSDVQYYLPHNPADMADAIRFLQRRWGAKVAGYELWNEPNDPHFMRVNALQDPATEYARLVATVYDQVKATDPATVIVAGSLANSDYSFTGRTLAAGAAHHFDAWSVHPYALGRSPLQHDPAHPIASPVDGLPLVHSALVAAGDGDRPLWLTEFGHSTCSARNQPQSWMNCVSEAEQATYLRQYLELFRSLPYVRLATYYELLDGDVTDDLQSRFGVLRADGAPKPAYGAFAAAVAGP